MAMIRFTANHDDLSTDRGYQFKFYCDKCGNGFMSEFQTSLMGTGSSLLRAAGGFLGDVFSRAGNSAYEIQRAIGGKAHDQAFSAAVEEAKQHFHQCTRCGKWVCPEVCWNGKAGLCEGCAPDMEEEMAAGRAQAMAQAAQEQLHEKARKTDYVKDVDMSREAKPAGAPLNCPHCGERVAGGKFCPSCGKQMRQEKFCDQCGAQLAAGAKFCPECGKKQG